MQGPGHQRADEGAEALGALLSDCRDRLATLEADRSNQPDAEPGFLRGLVDHIDGRLQILAAPVERESEAPALAREDEPQPVATAPLTLQAPSDPLPDLPVMEVVPRSTPAPAPASSPTPLIRRLPRRPRRQPAITVPDGAAIEQWLGERLFLKLGLVLVVAGVAWAFKYAYDLGLWGVLPPILKIGSGLLAGGTLLALGMRYERREEYRHWGRGLIAAGWPLLYFTAYAAHAFEASRVIHSPAIALLTLLGTAAAAIGFSLRYRSEFVTIAGFALGYLSLLLAGVSGLALVAGSVLTVALVVVLGRFRWQWLGVTGLTGSAITYLAWLEPSLGPTGLTFGLGTEWFVPSVFFPAVTWIAFAAGAHVTNRDEPWSLPAYLAVKNAFAFFVLFAVTPHVSNPANDYLWPLALGAAHLLLAAHSRAVERRPLFVAEVAIGVALLVLATVVKLGGVWVGAGWLAQATVLVLLGCWLAERPLRWLGYGVLALALARIGLVDLMSEAGRTVVGAFAARDVGLVLAALACGGLARQLRIAREWDILAAVESRAPEVLRWCAAALATVAVLLDVASPWKLPALTLLAVTMAAIPPRDEYGGALQSMLIAAAGLLVLAFDALAGVSGAGPALGIVAFALANGALARDRWAGLHLSFAAAALWTLVMTEVPHPWNLPVVTAAGLTVLACASPQRDRRLPAVGLLVVLTGVVGSASILAPVGLVAGAGARIAALTLVLVAAAAAHAWTALRDGEVPDGLDPAGAARATLSAFTCVATAGMAMALLHTEATPGWAMTGWALTGASVLAAALPRRLAAASWTAVVLLGLAAVGATGQMAIDGLAGHFRTIDPMIGAGAAVLLIAALATAAGVIAGARTTSAQGLPGAEVARVLGFAAIAAAGALIWQEFNAHWLTLGWACEGFVVLALGFALGRAPVRWAGTGILLFAAAKVVLVDVMALDPPYRIASFIGLGLMLGVASFAYARRRALADAAA